MRFMPGVPNRIAALRAAASLTQAGVAELIGVDQSTVRRWEVGSHAIPDARKVELAGLFGVSVGHLMCWPSADKGNNGNGENRGRGGVAA